MTLTTLRLNVEAYPDYKLVIRNGDFPMARLPLDKEATMRMLDELYVDSAQFTILVDHDQDEIVLGTRS